MRDYCLIVECCVWGFLFTLLMPFIVFSYDKLLTTITVNQAGRNMIAGAHVMVVAILAMLSNIVSASAISRDGGNFYTSKIIPVNYYQQIFAKLVFNAIFTTSAIIVTMIVSMFGKDAVPWQLIMGSVAVIFASIGHIAWSLEMDIKNPTINAQGDEESSTTSKSTPQSIITGLVIGFVLGIIVILALITTWRYYVANILSGIIFSIYTAWLVYAFYLNLGVCLLL